MTAFLVTDAEGIIGRVDKQTAEVTRLSADFSRWLDGGEAVGSITSISLLNDGIANVAYWQADYPLPDPTATAPADSTPLVLTGSSITDTTVVNILVGAGTPGLSYIVSCLVTGSTSGRVKELNFLVVVDAQVNDNMVSSLTPAPANTEITVAGTTVLPANTQGTVFVYNTSGAPIQITLPATPSAGQTVDIVDAGGNASTYAITIVGDSGATINGAASYIFTVDNQSGSFRWSGTGWVVV